MEHDMRIVKKSGGSSHVFHWVICLCGWSHMINAARWAPNDREGILKRAWYNHAYNSYEQSILRELGGDDGILY